MLTCILVAVCIFTSSDSLTQQPETHKEYTGQLVASGLLSAGFGISAAIFHTRSNQVYEEYQSSTTIAQALERWDRVRKFDLYRNVCIAGSVLFLARFMYYHMKQGDEPTSTGFVPCLDIQYTCSPKISIGLQRHL
ncbi:MAG: hypothetical protein JSW02_07135 [candidate division WOR-3 bacterium]|nr:MAG: hypothetical protein JSW02_07135 [candidate division WOR-3 bacterium]